MKQPIIHLHQSVYDKLDNLVREYRRATGENISCSKIVDKLIKSINSIEINNITIKIPNEL